MPPPDLPAAPARATVPERRETARVDSVLLDTLLNNAGEISIFQSRLSQQVNQIQFNLEELNQTVVRLRDQLRKLEIETEAQILHRHQDDPASRTEFDPLELDRYSTIQQLSRGLAETASDVSSIKDLLQNLSADTEALLVQQARTTTELQDQLMRTRMVPFDQHALAARAAGAPDGEGRQGKLAELSIVGSGDLDRQVLEKMLPPFEHMLRNAVIHGLESPAEREVMGKPRRRAASSSTSARRRRGRHRDRRRRPRPGRRGHPAQGGELGFVEPGTRRHRRGGDAVHPALRLQHGGPAHPGRRSRHRHGRGGQPGGQARRHAVHRLRAGAGAPPSRCGCRSRWRSPRR